MTAFLRFFPVVFSLRNLLFTNFTELQAFYLRYYMNLLIQRVYLFLSSHKIISSHIIMSFIYSIISVFMLFK